MQVSDTAIDPAQFVLQLHDVWKSFGPKRVLRGLDLDVRRGEIAARRVQLTNTSVVVTHDLALAARVADRIALLHAGRVVAIGPVATIEASTDPVVREFLDGRSA